MSRITHIVIHCSDSFWGCAREIRRWHLARGWRDIGYHFVILNGRVVKDLYLPVMDGQIEAGRDLHGDPFLSDNEIGAHALGYNDKSIGICLIGVNQFSAKQMESLCLLLLDLCKAYNIEPDNIIGHYETPSAKAQGKTCPNFDVRAFREVFKNEYYYNYKRRFSDG